MKEMHAEGEIDKTYLISAGIDIGTTTTQLVFSKLNIEEKKGYGLIPKVSIHSKDILYKSPIYNTPLLKSGEIDAIGIKNIVEKSYLQVGLRGKDIDTGAIIITGESARKRNAKEIMEGISTYVGHFIAYAAGGHLESVLAGKGSGAWRQSKETGETIVNFDIGGGTTNVACFRAGVLIGTACLHLGAKAIVEKEGEIDSIASHYNYLLQDARINLKQGDLLVESLVKEEVDRFTDLFVSVYKTLLGMGSENKYVKALLVGDVKGEILFPDVITFSGGVADCIWSEKRDFIYHDMGVLLGRALRKSDLMNFSFRDNCSESVETIQATVIGASQYAVSLSGSTIFEYKFPFPMNNVPVLFLDDMVTNALQVESEKELRRSRSSVFAIYVGEIKRVDYKSLEILTDSLYDFIKKQDCLLGRSESSEPFICVFKTDIAKAIGQMLIRKLRGKRAFLSIDGLSLHSGDVIDIGMPITNGSNIPVIIKTLDFE